MDAPSTTPPLVVIDRLRDLLRVVRDRRQPPHQCPCRPRAFATGLSGDVSAWVQDTGAVRIGLLVASLVAVAMVATHRRAKGVEDPDVAVEEPIRPSLMDGSMGPRRFNCLSLSYGYADIGEETHAWWSSRHRRGRARRLG